MNIKKITTLPITSIFIVAYAIKVGFSFYWFKHLTPWADSLSAISFLIIIYISTVGLKPSTTIPVNAPIYLYKISVLLLIFSWLLYVFPVFFFDETTPILEAVFGDHRIAHETRIIITKESGFSSLLDITGKIFLTVPVFIFGLSYRSKRISEKIFILSMILITVCISLVYFQKAMPFSILGAFLFGLLATKSLSKKMVLLIVLTSFSILFFLSSLFVADSNDTIIKFNDLVFRRLGQVPALVYQAYIDYGKEYPPLFLQNNFILNKSPDNPALPMLIYSYMSYGESSLGWANGLFIGDAYVNFGTAGVIITACFIGWLLRLGNKLSNMKKMKLSTLFGMLSISLLAFYVPGNAFYGFTIFLLILIFITSYLIAKYNFKFS